MNSKLTGKLKALKKAEEKAIESMTPERHEELVRKLIESGVIIDSGWSYEDYWRAWQKAPQGLKSSMILTAMTGQKELTYAYKQPTKQLSRIYLTPKGYKSVYIPDISVYKQNQFNERLKELNEINKALEKDPNDKELLKEKDETEDRLQQLITYDKQVNEVNVTETLEEKDYERLARGLELFANNKDKILFSEFTDDEAKDTLLTTLDSYLTHIQAKLNEMMSGEDIDKFWNFAIYEGTAEDDGTDDVNSQFRFALKGMSVNFTEYLSEIIKIQNERQIDMRGLFKKVESLDWRIRDCSNKKIVSKLGDSLVNKNMIEEVKDRVRNIQQDIKDLKTYIWELDIYAKE